MIDAFLVSTFDVIRQTKSKNTDGSESITESQIYTAVPSSIQWQTDDRVFWHQQEQTRLTAKFYFEQPLVLLPGDFIVIDGVRHKYFGGYSPVNLGWYYTIMTYEKIE
jgi:hypothetical protein